MDSVIPVVQLSDSSEEYGDSSAADKIAEFTSACAEEFDDGTSEGPSTGRSSSP